jgi:alanine racemase
MSQVAALVSAKLLKPVDVFVKVNTGMNRLGFVADEVTEVCKLLATCPNVREVVAMTHFADADGKRGIDWQMQKLKQTTQSLDLKICAANSAALIRFPESHGAWVRPGIMLYGASPFFDIPASQLELRPVMTLRSQIIAVQKLAAGDCVGYACTFEALKPMRIGIVAVGYGDGYPRHAPSGTPILVDGQRVQTVGRVSMDTMCVDLSALPEAGVGTRVTLWGEGMPVEEVATAAGTVSYELLTRVTKRVPFTVSG